MPKLQTTVAITTKETVKLEQKLRQEVRARLLEFQQNKQDLAALELEQERLKDDIDRICDKYGASGALQSGFKIDDINVQKFVGQRGKRLNKKKLIGMGVTVAMLEEATTSFPKKDFITIRLPGDKQQEGDDE